MIDKVNKDKGNVSDWRELASRKKYFKLLIVKVVATTGLVTNLL